MFDAQELSLELLAELEGCWRALDAEIVGQLRPGLSDREIDALIEPLGFSLPAEARLWWRWHDGAEHDDPSGRRSPQQLGPMIGHPSLAQAVRAYYGFRRFASTEVETLSRLGHEVGVDELWPAWWLPLTLEQEPGAIDTRPARRAPVHVMDYEDPSYEPVAGSIGELVALWIEAMRSGAWTYDASERVWRNDGSRFREELRAHPYIRAWLF